MSRNVTIRGAHALVPGDSAILSPGTIMGHPQWKDLLMRSKKRASLHPADSAEALAQAALEAAHGDYGQATKAMERGIAVLATWYHQQRAGNG